MSDISIIYYTCNEISDTFASATISQLIKASTTIPIISVSHQPMLLGTNIVVDLPRSHFNIYRQALIGAKSASTSWISLCEDDQLYSPAHFEYRPKNKPFAYNLAYWGLYSWQDPPMYNYKGRRNLGNLICDRLAFIEAMEERFQKYPNPDDSLKDIWAEPSKYERQLGVAVREAEDFYSQPPNIKFSHQTELSFAGLGTRKRSGELRAYDIPYWGRAESIAKHYE